MRRFSTKVVKRKVFRLLSGIRYGLSGSLLLLFWILVAVSVIFIVGIVNDNKVAYDLLFDDEVRSQHFIKLLGGVLFLPILLFVARAYSYYRSGKTVTSKKDQRRYEVVRGLQKTAVSNEVTKGVV